MSFRFTEELQRVAEAEAVLGQVLEAAAGKRFS